MAISVDTLRGYHFSLRYTDHLEANATLSALGPAGEMYGRLSTNGPHYFLPDSTHSSCNGTLQILP